MSDIKQLTPLRVSPQPTQKIGKSERTRATILNAALDFIWTQPFMEMTVSSLMSTTDMSRAAFYQYFRDLHEVMEALLDMLQAEIFDVITPWVMGVGDPVALIYESLDGLVRVCSQRGPFLRAIADAATTDERFEKDWNNFLGQFDDVVCARIDADQKQGLIPNFDARPVAIALNRLDAYTLIEAFGQHPRREPEPVREALARIWISTLYSSEWLGKESSNLVRKT